MSDIQISGLTKRFGNAAVLQELDLTVRDGEFLTLLGASGCGKSTLLKLIAGLDTPDTGTIRMGDRDLLALSPSARDCAMVFQSYALYPHMTVRENISMPLVMRGLGFWGRLPGARLVSPGVRRRLADIHASAHEVARRLAIDGLLDRKPAHLSGGQRQRVALARAMVRHPSVFLFDEPLSNLDANLRHALRAEIRQLHDQLGVTFIYVTHDQHEAMSMSDRVAVMREGRILQVAPPEDLYMRPQSLEVARFVGAPRINVVPGDILALGRQLAFSVSANANESVIEPRCLDIINPMGLRCLSACGGIGIDQVTVMGPRNIGMRTDTRLQVVLTDAAEQRVGRVRAHAAGDRLEFGREVDERDMSFVAGTKKERDGVPNDSGRRCHRCMDVCAHETIRCKLEQFPGVHDKGARDRWCFDPAAILALDTETLGAVLEQDRHETAVLVRPDALFRAGHITAGIANDLQVLTRSRFVERLESTFRLPESKCDGFQQIDRDAGHFGLVRRDDRLQAGHCRGPLVRANRPLPCGRVRTNLGEVLLAVEIDLLAPILSAAGQFTADTGVAAELGRFDDVDFELGLARQGKEHPRCRQGLRDEVGPDAVTTKIEKAMIEKDLAQFADQLLTVLLAAIQE